MFVPSLIHEKIIEICTVIEGHRVDRKPRKWRK